MQGNVLDYTDLLTGDFYVDLFDLNVGILGKSTKNMNGYPTSYATNSFKNSLVF